MAYEDEEKKQYMVIKIKKPHHAERLGWIVLIAFLLTIIIFQWISWPEDCLPIEPQSAEEKGAEQQPVVIETPKEEKKIAEMKKEEKKEGNVAPVEGEKKTEEKKLSGRIEVAISKVVLDKKGLDFGKITSVSYSIDNQKKDFVPLVHFLVYDSQWKDDLYTAGTITNCCEHQPQFTLPLKTGAPLLESKFTFYNGNGFSVRNLNETKTVKMEVYDKTDTKIVLAATEYTLKSDMWK